MVSTPLKNISQMGVLFPIYGKKNVPNHQTANHIAQYWSDSIRGTFGTRSEPCEDVGSLVSTQVILIETDWHLRV